MKKEDLPETCAVCGHLEKIIVLGFEQWVCDTLPIEMIAKNYGQCAIFEERGKS